jgi:hypothetical protein
MKQVLLAGACVALLATAASADESWTSSIGDIIYEAEIDGVAIFTYPAPNVEGGVGRLYFPGLAGNYENRGSHTGYWIAPGDAGACPATLTGADGVASKDFGSLLIVFHEPGYPTGWTLVSGTCFGPLVDNIVAAPKVAGEVTDTPPPPPPPPSN